VAVKGTRISVKEYAKLNRISIYQVIRKIQRGELQGETAEENGVRVNYVVLDTQEGADGASSGDENGLESGAEERLPEPEDPLRQITALREEVARLRALVERCCAERGVTPPSVPKDSPRPL